MRNDPAPRIPASFHALAAGDRLRTQVCILGMGPTALIGAYRLARQGVEVVLIGSAEDAEPEACPSIEPLAWGFEPDPYFGRDVRAASMGILEEILETEGLAFRMDRWDYRVFGALPVPEDAWMVVGPFRDALTEAIGRRGCRFYPIARARKVEPGNLLRVTLRNGALVEAESVVVACHSPIDDLLEACTWLQEYRLHTLGVPVPGHSVGSEVILDPDGFEAWFTSPASSDHVVLWVEGESHRAGKGYGEPHHQARLETWAGRMFSAASPVHRGSKRLYQCSAWHGFVGTVKGGQGATLIARGGPGLARQICTGEDFASILLGRKIDGATVFDPPGCGGMNPLVFGAEAREARWECLEWIDPDDSAALEAIRVGQGAVLRQGEERLPVVRDPAGHLRRIPGFCPNEGRPVSWNAALRSWDCACHGQPGIFF